MPDARARSSKPLMRTLSIMLAVAALVSACGIVAGLSLSNADLRGWSVALLGVTGILLWIRTWLGVKSSTDLYWSDSSRALLAQPDEMITIPRTVASKQRLLPRLAYGTVVAAVFGSALLIIDFVFSPGSSGEALPLGVLAAVLLVAGLLGIAFYRPLFVRPDQEIAIAGERSDVEVWSNTLTRSARELLVTSRAHAQGSRGAYVAVTSEAIEFWAAMDRGIVRVAVVDAGSIRTIRPALVHFGPDLQPGVIVELSRGTDAADVELLPAGRGIHGLSSDADRFVAVASRLLSAQ